MTDYTNNQLQYFMLNADYKATDESAPVNAKKEIKLLRLPRILVLHMCRFTYGNQGLTKLHKQMQFSLKLRCVHTVPKQSWGGGGCVTGGHLELCFSIVQIHCCAV